MTNPSPWTDAQTIVTPENFNLTDPDIRERLDMELSRAIAKGIVRGDWKLEARSAVADGIAKGIIHTTENTP